MERFVERFTVRKGILLATLVASVACTRKVVDTTISPATGAATTARLDAPSAGQAGAPTSRAAVEAFLAAVRGQDLRGMSAVWGNEKEPTAAHIKRDELEKRLIVMQCMLSHDKFQFAEDQARMITGGRQEHIVNLQQKQLTGRSTFTTVVGQGARWFVEDIRLDGVKDFCR